MNLLGLITRSDMVVGEKKKKKKRQTDRQSNRQIHRQAGISIIQLRFGSVRLG